MKGMAAIMLKMINAIIQYTFSQLGNFDLINLKAASPIIERSAAIRNKATRMFGVG